MLHFIPQHAPVLYFPYIITVVFKVIYKYAWLHSYMHTYVHTYIMDVQLHYNSITAGAILSHFAGGVPGCITQSYVSCILSITLFIKT